MGHNRAHKTGSLDAMPASWVGKVVEEVERRDADPSLPHWYKRGKIRLAEEVGCKKSQVTKILQGGQHNSRYAPRIAEVLGIPLPGAPLDDDVAELVELLLALPTKDRAMVIDMARRLHALHVASRPQR